MSRTLGRTVGDENRTDLDRYSASWRSDDPESLKFSTQTCKSKIIFTDFVVSCGGVFGSPLEHYLSAPLVCGLLETHYSEKIQKMLR